MTRMVDTIIQPVSPLLGTGAGGADAAAAGAATAAAGAGATTTAAGAAASAGLAASDAAGAAEVTGAGVWAKVAVPPATRLNPNTREANSFFISVFLLWSAFSICKAFALQSFLAGFTSADTHDLLKVVDKHLAVTDLAGTRCALYRFNHAVYQFVSNCGFNFYLG